MPVSAGKTGRSLIYLDTSAVVALPTPEEHSPLALDWFAQRYHGLSPQARQAVGEQFERLLLGGVELRSLDRDRFHQAAKLLQDPALGLRPARE